MPTKNNTFTKKQKMSLMTYRYATAHPIKPHPVGESLTVPDQSLSCRQIMDRHVRGLRTPDALLSGSYDEGNDPLGLNGRMFQMLDLEDKMSLIKDFKKNTSEKRKAYTKQEQEKAAIAQKQQFEAAVKAAAEAQKSADPTA